MDKTLLLRGLLAAALATAACTQDQAKPAAANPNAGSVKMHLSSVGRSASSTAAPAVCATFSLAPYSLGSGGAQTPAGSPVVINATQASVSPILGCVATPGVSPDWRYVVTASGFVNCATGASIPGLSPAVETFNVDVTCLAGKDVSAQVTAEVSIPVPNAGGYIDIGVGVNVDTPQSGCKDADVDANGQLHFGQSYLQTTGGPTPSAYTGIGLYTDGVADGVATPAGTLQQFAGSVSAGGNTDAYFTGLLTLPALPQTVTLVQAFAKPCPGQMTIQPRAVECVTQAHAGSVRAEAGATTSAQIADVFVEWPGHGAVSATASGSSLTLLTSLGGPHLSTLSPKVLGHDDLTHTQTLSLAPANVTGVYGSLLHVGELFALVQGAGGLQVVALVLNQTTGQWVASPARPLTDFSSAQQQAMGLFGAGGCFPMPEGVLCDPTASATGSNPVAAPTGKSALTSHSAATPSGTISVVIKHADGTPVDAAHPVVPGRYHGDPLTVNVQWEVSDIPPGGYAYPTVGYCDPAITLTSTIPTSWAGSTPCVNGYLQPLGGSQLAFTPVQASSGGVTQTFQFTMVGAPYFYDQPNWTIPFALYVSTTSTADVTTDTLVPTTGTTSVTLPVTMLYTAQTIVGINRVTPVAAGPAGAPAGAGWIMRLSYQADTFYYNTGHYLTGTSQLELSPPTFTNGLNAYLVPNSPTSTPDAIQAAFAYAAPAKQLNTNITPITVTPDGLHGGIPHVSIDNLLYDGRPVYYAEWFILEPTQQGTILSEQANIHWNNQDFSLAGYDGFANNGTDISPIPVNEIQMFNYHLCGDGFPNQNSGYTPRTKYALEYNAGTYLADGTYVASPSATPTYPAPNFAANTCVWGYNGEGLFEFLIERGNRYPLALNPVYVLKVAAEEEISSTSLVSGAAANASAVWTSIDPACNYKNSDNSGSVIWTQEMTPASGSFASVACVRYEFTGLIASPVLYRPFDTKLKSSITAGAPIGAKRFGTMFFWYTASNVIPDITANDPDNRWAGSWLVNTWENSTVLQPIEWYNGVNVPVNTVLQRLAYAHFSGLPIPDYTLYYKIAPGAVYDIDDPNTWFHPNTQKDVNGDPITWTCAIDTGDHTLLTCFVKSSTGALLAPGLSAYLQPQFKFLTEFAYNGQQELRQAWMTSSAAWLQKADGTGPVIAGGGGHYDTILGPNSLLINKAVHGGATTVPHGAIVPFDIDFGAQGADSGQLGAGGVEVFDFFGKDYLPGLNGAPGTLVAQGDGCVAPVPVSVSYTGNTGYTGSGPGAPDLYYTTDAAPGITNATTWVAVPPGGALPAGTTGIKIVPNSSQGDAGVLLPIDGTGHVQVKMSAPSGVTGKLCNTAALSANAFQTTATPEAFVTLPPLCESSPWPQ